MRILDALAGFPLLDPDDLAGFVPVGGWPLLLARSVLDCAAFVAVAVPQRSETFSFSVNVAALRLDLAVGEPLALDSVPSPLFVAGLERLGASPSAAMRWWSLPVSGIGLARMEFIINNLIQVHPLALISPEKVEDKP